MNIDRRQTLWGGMVHNLSPEIRDLICEALDRTLVGEAGAPRQFLQSLQEALQQGDPARAALLLQAQGRHWAEEGKPIAALAEQAIAAVRKLSGQMRSIVPEGSEEVDVLQLSFLSEVLSGYVHAREKIAARRRSEELSARMSELAALHKVISVANSSLDLDATLHLVVQTVAEVMQVAVCELYLFEPERGSLVLGASVGLNPEAEGQLRLRLGDGVTGWVAQQGQPVAVPDVRQEPRFLYEPTLHEDAYQSLLSVPIVLYTVEKLVGVINVRTREVRHYTTEEVNFLEMIAGEMAISLENAQLYQETDQRLRQKVEELTTLQRVSARVVSTLDLEETLGLISEQAAKLGRADMAVIIEWSPLRRTAQVSAAWGLQDEARSHLQEQLQQGDGHTPMVSASGAIVVRADGETPLGRWIQEVGWRTLLCIPLRGKEGLLGVICLHTERPSGFGPEQIDLLTVFAAQAALAIENARLYGELRRSLETKTTLLREMQHRVRNNLQAVASLLNMQMRRLQDPQIVQYLGESVSRIQGIAAVHDLLCEGPLDVTTVQEVAKKILKVATAHLARPGLNLQGHVVEEPPLPIGSKEATLLALLVNELISNAISHGFSDRNRGTIIVDAYLAQDSVVLQVKDDGLGPVEKEGTVDGGLGLQIVQALVTRDLEGTFSLQRDGAWTVAIISFPYRPPPGADAQDMAPLALTAPHDSS